MNIILFIIIVALLLMNYVFINKYNESLKKIKKLDNELEKIKEDFVSNYDLVILQKCHSKVYLYEKGIAVKNITNLNYTVGVDCIPTLDVEKKVV